MFLHSLRIYQMFHSLTKYLLSTENIFNSIYNGTLSTLRKVSLLLLFFELSPKDHYHTFSVETIIIFLSLGPQTSSSKFIK